MLADIINYATIVPVFILGVMVLIHWIPSAHRALKSPRPYKGESWLIFGIVLGFLSVVVDQAIVRPAFSKDIAGLADTASQLFRIGAAIAHLIAFSRYQPEPKPVRKLCIISGVGFLVAFVYFLITS